MRAKRLRGCGGSRKTLHNTSIGALKQILRRRRRRRGDAEVPIRQQGRDPPARGALQITLLNQIGFEHIFNRVGLFTNRRRDIVETHRPTGKLLMAIIEKFAGGPVGLDNVAAAIGEESDTIEDVLEPYLIQQGYLQRTPRGRVATLLAYRHFGITAPSAPPTQDLF